MMSQHGWKLLIPVVVAILFVPIEATTSAAPARAKPAKHDARTILSGIGLKGCRIGGPIRDALALFGKPSSVEGEDLQFAGQGVECSIEEKKVCVLFFHYRSQTHKPYAGKTEKGIGKESSIEDVIKQYGKPDRIDESVVSQYGPKPGAREHYLPYAKLGIAFTFYDKKLANVRVFAKEQ
jgi:hypothetical protein